MFEQHPTFREFGEALGGTYSTGRRLVESGAVRKVHFPREARVHKDDANKLLADGMTDAQRELYSSYVKNCNQSAVA